MRDNRTAVFPTDFIYDTVLGITGIETGYYDASADLSSADYSTSDIELRLIYGQRRFMEGENARYHQRRNVAMLADARLLSRVLPHRVNTTGMLAQVLFDGFRALEMDLRSRGVTVGRRFDVGHDLEHESGNPWAICSRACP